MKTLVTGSAGFIGQHLSETLIKQEIHVLEIDKVYGTGHDLRLHRSEELLGRMVSEASNVYHLAGIADPNAHSDPAVMRGDIQATNRVLEACHAAHKPLVVVSSAYAMTQNSHYGITKSVVEIMAELYRNQDLQVSVARLFNVYGPGQEHAITYQGTVVLNLIRSFKEGKFTVTTRTERDFVYITDVIDNLQKIMAATEAGENCLADVGSGHLTSILDLGHAIAHAMGHTSGVAFEDRVPKDPPPYEHAAVPFLTPKFSLDDGILLTVAHLR